MNAGHCGASLSELHGAWCNSVSWKMPGEEVRVQGGVCGGM